TILLSNSFNFRVASSAFSIPYRNHESSFEIKQLSKRGNQSGKSSPHFVVQAVVKITVKSSKTKQHHYEQRRETTLSLPL
ncbi:hypothetical protein QTO17_39740, partial [Vibrio owensii]